MAITRFAISTPSANTNTKIYTADRQAIVSVIATNKASTAATIRIWVQPYLSSTESEYVYQSYDVVIPSNNSIETFRFAVEVDDDIYVRASSANISFSVNGIYEEVGRQFVTVSNSTPGAPAIGDIWFNPNTTALSCWNGTTWVAFGSSAALNNLETAETVISTTSATVVDTFATSEYTTVEYLVQMAQGSNKRSSKVMVLTDGTSISHTEYAILSHGTAIPATVSTDIDSGNGRLKIAVSPLSSNVVVNVHRTAVET